MGKSKFKTTYDKECVFCRKKYKAFSQKSKFCSDNHRQLYYIRNKQEKKDQAVKSFVDFIAVPKVNVAKEPMVLPTGYYMNQLPRKHEYVEEVLIQKRAELLKAIENFKSQMLTEQWKEYYSPENFT